YGNVGYGGIRNPLHNRKGACWKLSACGCARRISILTPTRSSVEVSVMEMERRGWIIWPYHLVNQ
ncbi:MAG: hypothetical protein ABSB22_24620, partial [Thermodesulfobacteriota bacterium]